MSRIRQMNEVRIPRGARAGWRGGMPVAALLLTCVAHAPSVPAGDADYNVTSFYDGTAYDIGDSGTVVGDLYFAPTVHHAFIAPANGGARDLGALGDSYSVAYAVNGHAQVAGYTMTAAGRQRAFLSAADGGALRLLGALGGTNSVARDVNDAGQVVGDATLAGDAAYHAFVSAANGGVLTDLGTLGGTNSTAFGINAAGQIAGAAQISGNLAWRAFFRAADGGPLRSLGTLGGTNSYVRGINDGGQVIGEAQTSGNLATHAFLSGAAGGALHDLGTLGGANSHASGVNRTGQVVGVADDVTGASRPFLYTGTQMVDLSALSAPGFVPHAINDYAQIVGGESGMSRELDLHPDWSGSGTGAWDDASNWNFGGIGALNGLTPGAPHRVTIDPGTFAVVAGPTKNTQVAELSLGGGRGGRVTLELSPGATLTTGSMWIYENATLGGAGSLQSPGNINLLGSLQVGAGKRIQVSAAMLSNTGTISVVGNVVGTSAPAELDSYAVTKNASGARIILQNAVYRGGGSPTSTEGGLANSGQILINGPGNDIFGAIDNHTDGSIIVSAGGGAPWGDATFYEKVINNGVLRVSAGSTATFFGLVTGAGAYTGGGASYFEGGFHAGNSPAKVTMSQVAVFDTGSVLSLDLAGTGGPGNCASCSGQIEFANTVQFAGGTLEIDLYNGYVPTAGASFQLFLFDAAHSGTFGRLVLPTLAPGLVWDTSRLYSTGSLAVGTLLNPGPGTGGTAPVPVPPAFALFASAFALLGARRRRTLATAVALTALAGTAQAGGITVTDLGALDVVDVNANGLNRWGMSVGQLHLGGGSYTHGVLVGTDGTLLHDYGTLGGSNGYAYGINDWNYATGAAQLPNGASHAFFADPTAPVHDLGTLGGSTSVGYALSLYGQVVGKSTTADGSTHAFISAAMGGALRDLGTLAGGMSAAVGVNDSGQAVGWSTFGSGRHAFISDPDGGTLHDLGTLGGESSVALGVSADGRVVGYSNTTAGAQHAFLSAPNGGALTDLGSLGGSFSLANAVNVHGQVVGFSFLAGNGAQHAFLYTGGRLLDLNALPGVSGLVDAYAINEFGQILVADSALHASVITLQPRWSAAGGGAWSDSANWDFGGAGSVDGLVPGMPHDVTIATDGPATIVGPAAAIQISGLTLGGRASLEIASTSVLFAANAVDIGSTATLRGTVMARVMTNAGTLRLDAGQYVAVAETLTNTGTLHADDAIVSSGYAPAPGRRGGLVNHGRVELTGTTDRVTGYLDNAADGTVTLAAQTSAHFERELHNAGVIDVAAGGRALYLGNVSGAGRYTGAGTHYFESGFDEGAGPARVTFEAATVFEAASRIRMELAGNCADCYDQLVFAGSTQFAAGTLELALTNGYVPHGGDTFTLFAFGAAHGGTFGRFVLPQLYIGLYWDTSRLYDTGVISIGMTPIGPLNPTGGTAAVPVPAAAWLFASVVPLVLRRRPRASS